MKYLKLFEEKSLFKKINLEEYDKFVDLHRRLRIEDEKDKILKIIDGKFTRHLNSYRGKDSSYTFELPNSKNVINRSIDIELYDDEWFIVIYKHFSSFNFKLIFKCDGLQGLSQFVNEYV